MARFEDLAKFAVPRTPRLDTWSGIINARQIRSVAEIGVWKGEFAEQILTRCPGIERYYMVDPWRRLDSWNKPANVADPQFEEFYRQALRVTEPWADKRVVLRGRTIDVVEEIEDGTLDLAYVDGDHSLRGIALDLQRMWPKVRDGGILGGDDFTPWMYQHGEEFEPSAVFPYAVYFAEAVDAPIETLPRNQFAIHKVDDGYRFIDYLGRYKDLTVRAALSRPKGEQLTDTRAGRGKPTWRWTVKGRAADRPNKR